MKLIFITIAFIAFNSVNCINKYSKEANDEKVSLKDLDKPFRMQKLNLLWAKAKVRLSEPKLKSLFGELKIQDKEEVTWKRLKSEGKDKDGLKEAELRRKLLGTMSLYGLLEHFENGENVPKYKHLKDSYTGPDDYINKSLFKDKKLNKLWAKAETAGFTSIELEALREEFTHHQDKIDQYYSILEETKDGPNDADENSINDKLDRFNTLERDDLPPNKDYIDKVNLIREKHKDLKDGYDRLFILAAKGPNSKEFVEPKVQGLWKMALETNFTSDELESLRIELLHYEDRLLKLRNMQVEAALSDEHLKKTKSSGIKIDAATEMNDNIKKQAHKVEKLHLHLETKIMQKHIEL